jgi:hypothetical protein
MSNSVPLFNLSAWMMEVHVSLCRCVAVYKMGASLEQLGASYRAVPSPSL